MAETYRKKRRDETERNEDLTLQNHICTWDNPSEDAQNQSTHDKYL